MDGQYEGDLDHNNLDFDPEAASGQWRNMQQVSKQLAFYATHFLNIFLKYCKQKKNHKIIIIKSRIILKQFITLTILIECHQRVIINLQNI